MDDAAVMPARHKLDVHDYYRMAEVGILARHDRVELIDGEIMDMAPIGQGHAGAVNWLNQALVLACGDRAIVSTQNSVRNDRWNAPQPDFAVFRFRADFYMTGMRASPADVLLVIEVSDSSLRYDQTVKLPLYARAGLPEYWVVDLQNGVLDAYHGPEGDGYAQHTPYRQGARLALATDPGIALTLDKVFG